MVTITDNVITQCYVDARLSQNFTIEIKL